jgi:hypothetical protein
MGHIADSLVALPGTSNQGAVTHLPEQSTAIVYICDYENTLAYLKRILLASSNTVAMIQGNCLLQTICLKSAAGRRSFSWRLAATLPAHPSLDHYQCLVDLVCISITSIQQNVNLVFIRSSL